MSNRETSRPPVARPVIQGWPACLAAAGTAVALLVGCGGGSDDTAVSSNPPAPAPAPAPEADPTDKAGAIANQYRKVAQARAAVDALVDGDERALQALTAGRHAQWDAYWTSDYPALVDRLDEAARALQRSEDHVQRLVHGLNPDAGTAIAPKIATVVIPVALLAAVVITNIVIAERERLAKLNDPPTPSEDDELIAAIAAYYQRQGLTPVAAQTRAIADHARVKTLRGVKIGIEHGKVFVIDTTLKPGLGTLLPDSISTLADLKEVRDQLGDLKDNLEVIFTDKQCRTGIAPRALSGVMTEAAVPLPKSGVAKATEGCRILFCSTADDTCSPLPEGDWEATVLTPDHLRDIDLDVAAVAGVPATVDASPVLATDIADPAPLATCSSVQTAGGDTADVRNVPLGATSGSFSFNYEVFGIRDRIQIHHDGAVLFDTGCVSGGASRMIPYSGVSRFVTVEVLPNCAGNTRGTAWNYAVSCPGS